MKKKIVLSGLALFAVIALLFTGVGAIANANARAFVESRSVTGPLVNASGMTTAQASRAVGYTYWYNRNNWSGGLPRTSIFISNISIGNFSGNVQCSAPCNLSPHPW